MKQQVILRQNRLIQSDKAVAVMVKVLLMCSAVIVMCELYVLNKL